MKEKLEILKNLLICACLVVVLFTSCRQDKTAAALLSEINMLKAVVCETQEDAPTLEVDEAAGTFLEDYE